MKKIFRILPGFILSGIALWLVLKEVSFNELVISFQKMNLGYLFLALVVVTINLFTRAFRWQLVLKPIREVSLIACFRLTSIGYLVNNLLPLRMGDVVKGSLLKRYKFSIVEGVATVFLERVLDTAILILLFCGILMAVDLSIDLPTEIKNAGLLVGIGTFFMLLFLFLFVRHKNFFENKLLILLKRFPPKIVSLFNSLLEKVNTGFVSLKHPGIFGYIFSISVGIWLVDALVPYFFLKAFGISLDYKDALILLILIAISSIVPTAPGMVGVFQYVCVLYLTDLLNIDKSVSVSFSLAWNLFLYLFLTCIGILALIREKITFKDIFKARLKDSS